MLRERGLDTALERRHQDFVGVLSETLHPQLLAEPEDDRPDEPPEDSPLATEPDPPRIAHATPPPR